MTKLKSVKNWSLEFLGNAAMGIAAKCAELRDGASLGTEAKDNHVTRPQLVAVDKNQEVVAQTSIGIDYTKYCHISDIPSNLYLSPYFTMPSKFRTYSALVDVYRHELLVDVRELQGCNDFQAEVIVKSMGYYLTQLKAGNKVVFEGQHQWVNDYAQMCSVIKMQDTFTLAYRVALAEKFINQIEEDNHVLKGKGELLAMMKDSGIMPASAPLVMLDILAFISLPKYFKSRVDAINANLNSCIQIRGEFIVN